MGYQSFKVFLKADKQSHLRHVLKSSYVVKNLCQPSHFDLPGVQSHPGMSTCSSHFRDTDSDTCKNTQSLTLQAVLSEVHIDAHTLHIPPHSEPSHSPQRASRFSKVSLQVHSCYVAASTFLDMDKPGSKGALPVFTLMAVHRSNHYPAPSM